MLIMIDFHHWPSCSHIRGPKSMKRICSAVSSSWSPLSRLSPSSSSSPVSLDTSWFSFTLFSLLSLFLLCIFSILFLSFSSFCWSRYSDTSVGCLYLETSFRRMLHLRFHQRKRDDHSSLSKSLLLLSFESSCLLDHYMTFHANHLPDKREEAVCPTGLQHVLHVVVLQPFGITTFCFVAVWGKFQVALT